VRLQLSLVALVLSACGRTEPARPAFVLPAFDAGTSLDGGGRDAGHTDAGRAVVDAGPIDGGAPEPGPWAPKPCLPGTRLLERTVPLVLFVVDTSDSMAEPFDTSTKARAVKGVFEATIPAWDSTMLLGLVRYPVTDACGVIAMPETTPSRGQVATIVSGLGMPRGQSPFADAMTIATQTLTPLRAANTSRQLILITDGYPNCNAALSAVSCVCPRVPCLPTDCRDEVRVIERIRAANRAAIPSWVLGVDTGDAGVIDVLNQMAEAGGRARPWTGERNHAHGDDGRSLATGLREVGERIWACSRFSRSVPPTDTGFIVSLDGVLVPNDVTNGWSWVDRENGELVFQGLACDMLVQQPEAVASVAVRCSE
jgi:hypothetical protein